MKKVNKMDKSTKVSDKNKEDSEQEIKEYVEEKEVPSYTKKSPTKGKISITFDALFDKVKDKGYDNWIEENKEMV